MKNNLPGRYWWLDGKEVGTASVSEPVRSLLEEGPAELALGKEAVGEEGRTAVPELVSTSELPGGTMYPLEDRPAGLEEIADLLDDIAYPLEDGPVGNETVKVVGTVPT